MKTTSFKMTELGPIPSDWEVKRFCEVYSFAAAGDLQKDCFSPIQDMHHKYAVFSNGLANQGLYGYTSRPRYTGDSLTITGRGTLGHAEYRKDKFDAIIRLLILTPIEAIDNRFIVYWINYFNPFVNESTSIPQLTVPQVASSLFFLPPLPEQRRIAAALSDMDELIGALGKLVEKKRAIKTGAMQRLLTGQTRLPGFGGAEFKQTELGPIPSDWEVKRLGECGTFIGGGTPSTAVLSYWGGDIDWYTPAEIGNTKYVNASNRRITREGLKNSAARLLPVGTILLTTRASIGLRAILKREAATNQGFQSMVVTEACDSEFMYYNLSTVVDDMESRASGSTFLEISSAKLGEIPIVVPSLPEQRAIAAVLSDMDAEIAALEAEQAKYTRIKSGMMQELLTGKTRLLKGE